MSRKKWRIAIAIGISLTALLLAYCARVHQFLSCSENECWVKQPAMRIFLGGRFVYPIEQVESDISNVYFSVKTTVKNERSRLEVTFLTWFQTVPGQNMHIVSDNNSELLDTIASYGFQVHLAPCPPEHSRQALACKTGFEFDLYYEEKEDKDHLEWFCHFDDDVYVNTPALSKLLHQYKSQDSIYLGRQATSRKERIPVQERALRYFPDLKRESYYFATGAAYCLSANLMAELEFYLRGIDRFVRLSTVLGVPDDMTVGMAVESALGYDLTSENVRMQTHLEPLGKIAVSDLKEQVTISYGYWNIKGAHVRNVVKISPGAFNDERDPTRFYSYHCLLYPDISWCHNSSQSAQE